MRAFSASAAVCLFVLLGCSRIQHGSRPYHAAGTDLPVEVVVEHKPDELVSGTVYHRDSGYGAYEAHRMQLRADRLWALLPTDHLHPDDTVEYYIDVTKDGKLHALGSPGSPYVVTILDQAGMILASLQDRPYAGDEDHQVRIVLLTGHQPIDQPGVVYQMPGVPGDITAPMEADGRGNYHLIIPARAVVPGTWRYAIEVSFDGQKYRLPRHGYRSFVVAPAYHPEVAGTHP